MFASSRFNPLIGRARRVVRRRQAQAAGAIGARGRRVVRRRLATSADGASKSKDGERSPLYEFMWRERRPLGGANLTAVCLHASMVLNGLALANTDMLLLRATSLASSLFLGAFQYFRPQPSWTPLRWNAVFLSINAFMTVKLLIDYYEADHMPDEMNLLYRHGHFCHTFSKVQFNRFFKLGRRRELAKGEVIMRAGQPQTKLYYTERGECTAMANRREVGNILSHRFVGEISFLQYLKNSKPGAGVSPCDSRARASATVIAKKGGVIWEWDHEDLTRLLLEEMDISNAFQSYCAFDLGMKLMAVNDQKTGLSTYLQAKVTTVAKNVGNKNEREEGERDQADKVGN